jgi:septal ring factor EnvC (AmiA/AmiB activator)
MPDLVRKTLLILSLLINAHGLVAETQTIIQAKSKLKQLDIKINTARSNISQTEHQRDKVNQALATNDKQIGVIVFQLRELEQSIMKNAQKITTLKNDVSKNKALLKAQQELLAHHLRAQYAASGFQPLQWLLNQTNPTSSDRILTLHRYVIKSRQNIIGTIHDTEHKLSDEQENLYREQQSQQQLQRLLKGKQQQLFKVKQENAHIMRTLQHDIHHLHSTLLEYQQNKTNLSQLLQSLNKESLLQNQRSFMFMRRKLSPPVKYAKGHIEKINQGIIIFAEEGAKVASVYPGKVVFSDWLKGYGLLIILDHGRGFMTLYAHNQSLFKQKGEVVLAGEQIATVGHSGGLKKNGLYFEIRQRGKAISPLDWLY